MSKLPSGYTELEYIESSGKQWTNTGFNPKSTTRVKVNAKFLGGATTSALFGARGAASGTDPKSFTFLVVSQKPRSDYFGSSKTGAQTVSTSRIEIDWNKNVCSIDSDTITHTATSAVSDRALYLFAVNTAGSATLPASMQLYSCAIYDNGTLIRDFVPCKNASGAVGLYDLVGAKFYTNAGTGTFTAGPEVIYEPATPTNFTASVSGQTVALSWAAAANAVGYRLKRDGVQIAEQTGTTYTDTVPDEIALCTYTLTAYNDDGESAAAALTVILRLDLITDRTRADVENQTDKGFYNASDLNRVGAAVEYIAGRFTALGYACPVTVKKDWLTSDAPTASQMETYRQNIVTLRGQIAVMQSTPDAPASMAGLDYVKANNIEQILADMDSILQNMPAASRHCGVTVCGSKGVIA
mgnify:CR=1 FL=1